MLISSSVVIDAAKLATEIHPKKPSELSVALYILMRNKMYTLIRFKRMRNSTTGMASSASYTYYCSL